MPEIAKITPKNTPKNGSKFTRIGREPYTYDDPAEFAQLIQDYFQYCMDDVHHVYNAKGDLLRTIHRPFTIIGIQNWLGISAQCWSEYKGRPEFGEVIKKAEKIVEQSILEKASIGDYNPVFSIFRLKCNFGYVDKVVIEQSVNKPTDAEVEEKIKQLLEKVDK